jgi:hypothetical protein
MHGGGARLSSRLRALVLQRLTNAKGDWANIGDFRERLKASSATDAAAVERPDSTAGVLPTIEP